MSNFRIFELPITIDRKTYNSVFYPNNKYHEIPTHLVNKFICKNSINCPIDSSKYRYDYGIKFKSNNIQISLVHKQKYEGTSVYDFDLSEVILVSYSAQGEILSKKSVAKDNDGWISSIRITSDKIWVQQLKVLEFNKPELSCEIEIKEYKINQKGIIENTHTEPIKSGFVVWNEEIKDFTLKQVKAH